MKPDSRLFKIRLAKPAPLPDGMRPILSSDSGFTLIELMIVIAIIGILITAVSPRYKSSTISASEAVLKKDLFVMRDVIDQYYADKGKYPASLSSLAEAGYIRKVPNDPFTDSSKTWVEVSFTGEEGGIADVHSGSDLIGLDGTAYNDW